MSELHAVSRSWFEQLIYTIRLALSLACSCMPCLAVNGCGAGRRGQVMCAPAQPPLAAPATVRMPAAGVGHNQGVRDMPDV